jgi:hypothetical protein
MYYKLFTARAQKLQKRQILSAPIKTVASALSSPGGEWRQNLFVIYFTPTNLFDYHYWVGFLRRKGHPSRKPTDPVT